MSNPSARSHKLSRSTSVTICPRVEPSDNRMPISCLRLTARYAMMPYRPTVTMTIASTPNAPANHAVVRSATRRSRLWDFSSVY